MILARRFTTGLVGKARALFHGLGPKGDHPSRTVLRACSHCQFADPGAYPMTYCHRYAPREHRREGENLFPQVSRHDWCGEFEPR